MGGAKLVVGGAKSLVGGGCAHEGGGVKSGLEAKFGRLGTVRQSSSVSGVQVECDELSVT